MMLMTRWWIGYTIFQLARNEKRIKKIYVCEISLCAHTDKQISTRRRTDETRTCSARLSCYSQTDCNCLKEPCLDVKLFVYYSFRKWHRHLTRTHVSFSNSRRWWTEMKTQGLLMRMWEVMLHSDVCVRMSYAMLSTRTVEYGEQQATDA